MRISKQFESKTIISLRRLYVNHKNKTVNNIRINTAIDNLTDALSAVPSAVRRICICLQCSEYARSGSADR